MSETLASIQRLVAAGRTRLSEHGRDELAADNIGIADVIGSVPTAVVVEDYPAYFKGPSVLCLQVDHAGQAIHVLWGLAKNAQDVATLITAYRPDPFRWTDDFLARRPR
jgi:hypothetical protein